MPRQPLLPQQFSALEPFADAWSLETPSQRLHKRMVSTMPEIEAFYAAILPCLEAALNYLDEFPLGNLSPPEQRLYWLTLASAEAALAVEIYRTPTLPLAPDTSRFKISYSGMDG
jgi:hypothetical protein